jgi:hypothetical protein
MRKVGLRKLKNHRSAKAQRGLADLARRGLVSLGAPNDPKLYRRMPRRLKPTELQRLLDEERSAR